MAGLALAFCRPALAGGDVGKALDLDDPPLKVSVEGPAIGWGIKSNLGAIRPRVGPTMLVMSTGKLGSSPQKGVDRGSHGSSGDKSALVISLKVPEGANSLVLDFQFLSAEYPEYVGSTYNDKFRIDVTGTGWSGNAAKDPKGSAVNVNSVLFSVKGGKKLSGTGMDNGVGGSTDWVSTHIPVKSGTTVKLDISVADDSDGYYDSIGIVDGLRWSSQKLTQPKLVQGEKVSATVPLKAESTQTTKPEKQDPGSTTTPPKKDPGKTGTKPTHAPKQDPGKGGPKTDPGKGTTQAPTPEDPGQEIEAPVAPPEVELIPDDLPVECLVGEACSGIARAVATGITDQAELVVSVSGQVLARGPANAPLPVTGIFQSPGAVPWTVELVDQGQVLATLDHDVSASPNLLIVAPAALDFGQVPAGTPTLAEGHCLTLDLTGSTGLDTYAIDLAFTSPQGGCLSAPMLALEIGDKLEPRALPLEAASLEGAPPLCLKVPRCAGETAEGVLSLKPIDPRFASQAREIPVRWTVVGRPWYSCYGGLIGAGLLGMIGLFFAAGWIFPPRFGRELSIQIAGSEKGLARAASVRLVECRGSGPGLWRAARLGLHADGSVNGRLRGSQVRLKALRGGGIALEGPIEALDRRTRRYEAPADLAQGHRPAPTTIYRAGETWFRLEGL